MAGQPSPGTGSCYTGSGRRGLAVVGHMVPVLAGHMLPVLAGHMGIGLARSPRTGLAVGPWARRRCGPHTGTRGWLVGADFRAPTFPRATPRVARPVCPKLADLAEIGAQVGRGHLVVVKTCIFPIAVYSSDSLCCCVARLGW